MVVEYGMRILFVENNTSFAQIVKQQFLSEHDVQIVPSIEAAKAALRINRYGIVLLDYDLDDGKGIELLDNIRTHYPTAKVIAVSAIDTNNIALQKAGVHAVCAKRDFASIGKFLG